MDVFIHYALAASEEAVRVAQLEIPEELGPEVGVSIGLESVVCRISKNTARSLLNGARQKYPPFSFP